MSVYILFLIRRVHVIIYQHVNVLIFFESVDFIIDYTIHIIYKNNTFLGLHLEICTDADSDTLFVTKQ